MSGGTVDEAQVKEAVQQACLELNLPLSLRSAVRQLVGAPESEWPACCDTGCEPCQRTLGDAARRALELLGRPPAGGPR